ENGVINSIDGKTVSEYIKNISISHSHFNNLIRHIGIEHAKKYTGRYTSIELIIKNILTDNNIKFIFNKGLAENKRIKFDFLIDRVVIECDGLYWHSDLNSNESYHFDKMTEYKRVNYTPL